MVIGYVNLFVSDLDRAIDFYEGKLGMKLRFRDDDHGYASLQAGPIGLGLAVPGEAQQHLVGVHTGVGLVVDDLEEEHKRLAAAGVAFTQEPTRQPWGGFMALVDDPDGNVLYLDEVKVMHPS